MYARATARNGYTGKDGFSIIEVMIVLALIVGFLAIMGPGLYQRFTKGKKQTTQIVLRNVKQAIDNYKMDTRKLPQAMKDLYEKPEGVKGWSGPYLDKAEDPEDAWGVPLVYQLTAGGKHPYELYSYGADTAEEGTDETKIDVWEI